MQPPQDLRAEQAAPELLAAATVYHQLGLFPVPGDHGAKRPALSTWSALAEMARQGERLPLEQVIGIFRAAPGADAVGHLVLRGTAILDVDSPEALAALDGVNFRPGPVVETRRGRHYHFRHSGRLPGGNSRAVHFLGPGHYVELPPADGKRWLAPLDLPLSPLPPALLALVTGERHTRPSRATKTAGINELAPWRSLLPDLRGNGPWRATCPFHSDDRRSLSIYRASDRRSLLWRCHADGCAGSGRKHGGTLAWLRHQLRGDTDYALARRTVEAADLPGPAKAALQWAVERAAAYKLDLLDSQGIGASYRQLAAATGCEAVHDDGRLAAGGREVRRLLDVLRAAGIPVLRGQQDAPGQRGRATRLILAGLLHEDTAGSRGVTVEDYLSTVTGGR
jgi:hypothetical protein